MSDPYNEKDRRPYVGKRPPMRRINPATDAIRVALTDVLVALEGQKEKALVQRDTYPDDDVKHRTHFEAVAGAYSTAITLIKLRIDMLGKES